MRKIINHHIEGGTRESHHRVQDLQHSRLDKLRKPRHGWITNRVHSEGIISSLRDPSMWCKILLLFGSQEPNIRDVMRFIPAQKM